MITVECTQCRNPQVDKVSVSMQYNNTLNNELSDECREMWDLVHMCAVVHAFSPPMDPLPPPDTSEPDRRYLIIIYRYKFCLDIIYSLYSL